MTTAPKPHCKDAFAWLRANGYDLAPLTGTDTRALRAIAHVWELYSYSRSKDAIAAAMALASEMQRSTRHLARALIPHSMDWSDTDRVWPLNDGVWPLCDCGPVAKHDPARRAVGR